MALLRSRSSLPLLLCASIACSSEPGSETSSPSEDMSAAPSLIDMSAPDLVTPLPDMTSSPDMAALPADAVTYAQHLSPLLQVRCNSCHTAGGIAPFSFSDYEQARTFGALIASSVSTRRMPPWPPAKNCGSFRHDRSLSTEEIALVETWVAQGMLEGDPSKEVKVPPEITAELGEPDVVFDIGADYKPMPSKGSLDDHRCFVIDPHITEEHYLNAAEITPGNASIVHHVLYFAVPPEQRRQLEQLAAADTSGPGYACFGGPGLEGARPQLLGAWVPGARPTPFDPGHGIPIAPGAMIVMQVHYNTANDAEGSDRTRAALHFTEENEVPLSIVPVADFRLDIQAGDAMATETASFHLPNLPRVDQVKVYGVAPHMHQLGTAVTVTIERAGEELCLVDIPDWDFNWQGFYLYEEPVQLKAGDTISLTCRFDNSMAHNEQLGRQPRDITWGEKTEDEMCLNYLIINALP